MAREFTKSKARINTEKKILANIERSMRDHAYAIAGLFDSAKNYDRRVAKEMIKGIVDYLNEQKEIS